MGFSTLASLKTMLKLSGTSEDSRLQDFLDAADACIRSWCRRDFDARSYVEYHNGNGTRRLALRQRPVTAVSSVKVDEGGAFGKADGSFGSATALTEGVDWCLDCEEGGSTSSSGVLFRIGSVWPLRAFVPSRGFLANDASVSPGCIRVAYTAGYAPIPADISLAARLLAARMRRESEFGGYSLYSERLGDYSYRLGKVDNHDPEIGTIRSILARYRESGW